MTERERRIYYQDIVYHVCNSLDSVGESERHDGVVCGTADIPSREVQDGVDRLVARVKELERFHLASQSRLADAMAIIGDIEQIRSTEGNSVKILCDNPEADTVDQQSAVECCGDFTNWEPQRWYAESWVDALRYAAASSRSFTGSES